MNLHLLQGHPYEDAKRSLLRVTFLVCLLTFLPSIAVYGANEFHASNEFSYTYNDIGGPGSSQSSLRQGFSYLNLFNMNNMGNYKGFDYTLNFGFKLTDDAHNDPKVISLTNMQGRITNKIHTLNIGDTFESFSQYALSTALKGASYRFVKEKSYLPEVTLVSGYAYPRWDNLFGIPDRVQTIERMVQGARIKENLGNQLWAGVSYVQTSDKDRVNLTDPLYRNNALTADFEYKPIPGLTVTGETSFTNQTESPSLGTDETYRHGLAYRLMAVGDADPSRVTLEYEKISTNFTTLVGSATPDREKAKMKWRYKYNKDVTTNLGFLWFRDNLDGQKAQGTTDYYKPEIGVTVKRVFARPYSIADLTYKPDMARNNGSDKLNHIVNLNYQDRFGPFDSDTNLGYTYYDNKILTSERTNEYTYNTTLSSRHTVGALILKPAVYLGGWTMKDELAVSSDKLYEYSAGLGIDIPDWKITSSVKVGQNSLQKSAGLDSSKAFINGSIYYRPAFLAKLNQGVLFLRFAMNDYGYQAADRNFRETSITTGVNIQI